jgi:V8-like Glu-specific endopeptidase
MNTINEALSSAVLLVTLSLLPLTAACQQPQAAASKKQVARLAVTPQSQENRVEEITRRSLPFTVSITTFDEDREPLTEGSGFIVSGNRIITNYHVIKGCVRAEVTLSNERKYRVIGVMAWDAELDYAVLKIDANNALPTAPLGDPAKVAIGASVIAIGNPQGLHGTVSTGIVSAIRSIDGVRVIQTTAPISPGSSGGPLINQQGEVIGINSMTRRDGQNLNFSLPIDYVTRALPTATRVKFSLAELSEEEMKREIARLLKDYSEPQVFNLTVPAEWRIQRDRQWINNGETLLVTIIIAPEDAARTELHGYVSEGLRITVRMPREGRVWKPEYRQSWADKELVQGILRANPTFALTETGSRVINGQQVRVASIVGQGKGLPEPEKTIIYALTSQRALVCIELIAPTSKLKMLDVLEMLVAETFELKVQP